MVDAVLTEDLGKTFAGGVEAVASVSLAVAPGEIYGFLGPNGAGKTTTISMLTTLLRPTRGRAEIDGVDVARHPERVRREIGLVFQRSTADDALTGRENLEILAGLHGMAPRAARPRIDEILARLDLDEAADRRVSGYSGGMRRRLEIGAAIVHAPRLLFLDEPTLGLDPQGRAGFWQYIRELRAKQGMTIFLTTHYLDEADQLCDRLSIIDHGRLLRTGTPAALKDALGSDVVVVRPVGADRDLLRFFGDVPGAQTVERLPGEGAYRIKVARSESFLPGLVRACDAAGVELAAISARKPSLDEVFLEVTGREYREESEPHAVGTAPTGRRGTHR